MSSALRLVVLLLPALLVAPLGCERDLNSEGKPMGLVSQIMDPLTSGGTSLGVALVLPSDVAAEDLGAPIGYSPSGRYLSFRTPKGSILLLDLEDNASIDLKREYLASGHSLTDLVWLSDSHVLVSEHWDDLAAARQAGHPMGFAERSEIAPAGSGTAYRVIELQLGQITDYEEFALNCGADSFIVAGKLADGRFVGFTRDLQAAITADALDGQDRETIVDLHSSSQFFLLTGAARFPWVPYVADSRPRLAPLDRAPLSFLNLTNGETITIENMQCVTWISPPLLTNDGGYLFTVHVDSNDQRWIPSVTRVSDRSEVPLPSTESWVPVALSEARGVLLVFVQTPGENRTYFEISLASLISE